MQVEARLYQARGAKELAQASAESHPGQDSGAWPRAASGLLGRIEVPRLELSAVIAEGVDKRTLLRAVGHLPGSPLPGQPGNVALAGHRDTFFRPLRNACLDDRIRITTPIGSFEYVVESIEVVSPKRTEVLENSGVPKLTLITCYPFDFVGAAPWRWVVIARQVVPPPRGPARSRAAG